MEKYKKYILPASVVLSVFVIGFTFGYIITNFAQKIQAKNGVSGKPEEAAEIFNSDEAEKTTNMTLLIYEYFYKENNATITVQEKIPPFLAGKTKLEFAEAFSGWELVSFSPKTAIIRKVLDTSSENYIVTIYNGFVAVFYDGMVLKEVTNKPVEAFSESEAEKLKEGISVTGSDELFNLMQDYGS